MLRSVAIAAICLAEIFISSACHATDLKEVLIGLRVVDFLAAPLPAQSRLAILYDSHSKTSEDDSNAILGWITSSDAITKTSMVPFLLDVHNLVGAPAFQVGFLAAGLQSSYGPIGEFARKRGVVTISADLSCVRIGGCVVGVSSIPRVEVWLNRRLSEDAHIGFSEAFRMMVTEY